MFVLSAVRAYFALARPATLPAPLTSVFGWALCAYGGWPANPWPLTAALVSALFATAGSNALNQVADIETDRINRPERPIPAGTISLKAARRFSTITGLAALALGWFAGIAYFLCIIVTIPITAAYSLPPARTKRIPFLANATIATPRGLGMVIAGWAVGGGLFRAEAWVLGGLAWFYIFGASTTKDFGDIEGDQATGCRTLPILYGPKWAAWFVAPFLVIPFALYPVAAAVGWLPGGVTAWGALGGGLASIGLVAAVLLIKTPLPRPGKPHPTWYLMYAQLALAPLCAAALFASL